MAVSCVANMEDAVKFWLFLIYPGTSLTTFQTFICKRIYRDTYLIASLYKEGCPWGGLDLNIWRLDTWEPLSIVSSIFILVYPIGNISSKSSDLTLNIAWR